MLESLSNLSIAKNDLLKGMSISWLHTAMCSCTLNIATAVKISLSTILHILLFVLQNDSNRHIAVWRETLFARPASTTRASSLAIHCLDQPGPLTRITMSESHQHLSTSINYLCSAQHVASKARNEVGLACLPSSRRWQFLSEKREERGSNVQHATCATQKERMSNAKWSVQKEGNATLDLTLCAWCSPSKDIRRSLAWCCCRTCERSWARCAGTFPSNAGQHQAEPLKIKWDPENPRRSFFKGASELHQMIVNMFVFPKDLRTSPQKIAHWCNGNPTWKSLWMFVESLCITYQQSVTGSAWQRQTDQINL